MQAAVLSAWEKITVQEVPTPVPGRGEALIQVTYAGVCGSDVHIYQGTNPIAKTPVIPGHEFMGRIAAIGEHRAGVDVDRFSVAQRVVIQPLVFCGQCNACLRDVPHVCENLIVIGVNRDGGFAGYTTVPVDCLFPIPDELNDETAVLAEPFSVGMHAARRGELTPQDNVLIIGSGPIGLYAALACRKLGARTVHLSEPNQERRAYAEAFGFRTTDPTIPQADVVVREPTHGQGYDLVIETSGVFQGLDFASRAAAVRGRIVTLGFPAANYNEYNVTTGIVKELSLVGSRVCTRTEFGDTLSLLLALQNDGEVDFARLATQPRDLQDLDGAIRDVAAVRESAKILISPG